MKRHMIFGELLYDVMPDGNAILGGAPFNVARHLCGFGLNPRMISRVGDDERGRGALAAMHAWGMDDASVQIDPTCATGEVLVALKNGQPTFDIVEDRAWDHIDAAALFAIADVEIELIYHGTLALRSGPTHDAFETLVANTSAGRFLDVNLRSPYWYRDDVLQLMREARWIKLNEDEAAILWGDASMETATALRDKLGCEALIITRGEHGADVVTSDETLHVQAKTPARWVDTVGAGDAFTAVVIAGLHWRWAWTDILIAAADFASVVCGVSGALGLGSGEYERFLRSYRPNP